ncbi:MAG: hypothetical protein H6Q23_1907 [Bacteroidetes bacterium]|jgi:uncharacterized tellurite resistance protein B-like protein|nr:hypothetical protein [Bacteroidota bacterium]
MSFSDFITNHGKKVNKEAFINLVQVSKIDGKIQKTELELLHREGKKFGLTEPEIDHLIKNERDHQYHPPYSLEEKFDHIYNLAEMILADCEVTESEKKVIKKFAIESGFEYSKIDKLIDVLIEGVKSNYEEERLFRKFKKVLLS